MVRVAVLLGMLWSIASASVAAAQDPPEREPTPIRDSDRGRENRRRALRGEALDELSRPELESRGFKFQDPNARSDDSTAVVLALTAGFAVHGIGHFYMGDQTTGALLLGSQALSLGLMAGAGLAFIATDGASSANGVIAPLFSSGLALYVYSYLADVAGTISGPDSAFPRPNRPAPVQLSLLYGFTSSRGSPVRHALDARVDADLKWVTLSAQTIQDVFLETALYSGEVGVSPLFFEGSQTRLALRSKLDHVRHNGRGPFGRTSFEGRLYFALDSGDVLDQLTGFVLYLEGGYGNRWWSFVNDDNALEVQTRTDYIPYDFGVQSWLTRRLKVRGGYGSPRTPFVAASSRILGVAHISLTYKTSATLDLRLNGELGDGFSAWIGFGVSPF